MLFIQKYKMMLLLLFWLGLLLCCDKFQSVTAANAVVVSITIRPGPSSSSSGGSAAATTTTSSSNPSDNNNNEEEGTEGAIQEALEEEKDEKACTLVTLDMTTPRPGIQFHLTCSDTMNSSAEEEEEKEPLWIFPEVDTTSSLSFGFKSLTACIDLTKSCCEFHIENDDSSQQQQQPTPLGHIYVETEEGSIFSMKTNSNNKNRPFLPFGSFSRMFGDGCNVDNSAEEDEQQESEEEENRSDNGTINDIVQPLVECAQEDEIRTYFDIELKEDNSNNDNHHQQQQQPPLPSWYYLLCDTENDGVVTLMNDAVLPSKRSLTTTNNGSGSNSTTTTLHQEACIPSKHRCVFAVAAAESSNRQEGNDDGDNDNNDNGNGGYGLTFENQSSIGASYMTKQEFNEMAFCTSHGCDTLPLLGLTDDSSSEYHDCGTSDQSPKVGIIVVVVISVIALVVVVSFWVAKKRKLSSSSPPSSSSSLSEISEKKDNDDDNTVDICYDEDVEV